MTAAVPMDLVRDSSHPDAPLCPACIGGRLHPYRVYINLGGFGGYRYGTGWVARCRGAQPRLGETNMFEDESEIPPCGFVMSIIPERAE